MEHTSLRISSGDTVNYELLMAGHGQVKEGDSFADTRFDFDTLYNLLGPLDVEGARPGDTLKIRTRCRVTVRCVWPRWSAT